MAVVKGIRIGTKLKVKDGTESRDYEVVGISQVGQIAGAYTLKGSSGAEGVVGGDTLQLMLDNDLCEIVLSESAQRLVNEFAETLARRDDPYKSGVVSPTVKTPEPVLDYSKARICDLAGVIREDWKKLSPCAMPYVEAMETMQDIGEHYLLDSGQEIVLRFLCNASGWRGPTAKAVKAELKARTKSQRS